jgi:tryptophan synthase alpha chain
VSATGTGGAERIAAAFAAAKAASRPALIPYLTAGDPDLARSRDLFLALGRGGADLLEVGVPFSDPIADGPVIQRAAERALASGATLGNILELCARLVREGAPPCVLFTYYNPIHRMGIEAFAGRAAEAGLAGVLVTDLPPEEGEELRQALGARGLASIGFLAPTSSAARRRAVAAASTGFLYCIARLGVTGVRGEVPDDLAEQVKDIRSDAGGLPLAVGFGFKDAAQVRAAGRYADGVVVGSALVRVVEEHRGGSDLADRIVSACRALRGDA